MLNKIHNFLFNIKDFFDTKKKIKELQSQITIQQNKHRLEIQTLQNKIGDPKYVVDKIFERGIKWFDFNEASNVSRKTFFSEAQQILTSQVFNNLVNMIIATQCQEHVRQFNPLLPNPNSVARDIQMTINAYELLKEKLAEIPDPDLEDKEEKSNKDFDPYTGL